MTATDRSAPWDVVAAIALRAGRVRRAAMIYAVEMWIAGGELDDAIACSERRADSPASRADFHAGLDAWLTASDAADTKCAAEMHAAAEAFQLDARSHGVSVQDECAAWAKVADVIKESTKVAAMTLRITLAGDGSDSAGGKARAALASDPELRPAAELVAQHAANLYETAHVPSQYRHLLAGTAQRAAAAEEEETSDEEAALSA